MSVSSNMSEREGKKERKREREEKRGRERTLGARFVFEVHRQCSRVSNRGKKKKIDGDLTLVSLLTQWTGVLILRGVPNVLYIRYCI